MADWHAVVCEHLSDLALEPKVRADVIEELSSHLEETFEHLRKEGHCERESVLLTLSQVGDWNALIHRIQKVRSKEQIVSNRVAQFWLPSIVTLVLAEGTLALLQKFGPDPVITSRSGHTPVAIFYTSWLLALPLIGALGAYLSHRAGGSARTVLLSVLFPALTVLSLFLVVIPISLLIDRYVRHNIVASAFLLGLLGWVIVPGVALLVGGLPMYLYLLHRSVSGRVTTN